MAPDAKQFWNEAWSIMDESYSGPDDALVEQTKDLPKGRALEVGCGTGGNAIWLAEQGWNVTAVDYSDVAIEKAQRSAKERGVQVEFLVADASAYKADVQYNLITSFYIHLAPEPRKKMLALATDALAPGGTLLFVSHDEASPPGGWSQEDLETLTTPEQVVSELPGLEIEQAYVKKEEDGAHMHAAQDNHELHELFGVDPGESFESSSTIVVAIKLE